MSGAGAERETGVPVLDSKRQVESRIRAAQLPHTILAPVYLMENALSRAPPPAGGDGGRRALRGPRSGAASELRGERVELAGDELSGPEAAAALTRAGGRDIEYQELDPRELGSVSPGLVALFDWLDRVGTRADIGPLHRAYPEFGWQSFAQWAKARDWSWLGERCLTSRSPGR